VSHHGLKTLMHPRPGCTLCGTFTLQDSSTQNAPTPLHVSFVLGGGVARQGSDTQLPSVQRDMNGANLSLTGLLPTATSALALSAISLLNLSLSVTASTSGGVPSAQNTRSDGNRDMSS